MDVLSDKYLDLLLYVTAFFSMASKMAASKGFHVV